MKKIFIIALVCATLAACTKIMDGGTSETEASSFEKGQKVTLSVSAAATKVAGSLDGTTGKVNFEWEPGDKIMVIVGSESEEFTLLTGAGSSRATFQGKMPAQGSKFDVQYPVSEPDLSSQTYVKGGLPKDKMKFYATGCTLGTDFDLEARFAALRLNLYGLNREISQIVVTNTSSTADVKPSYTLTCSTPVRVGNSKSNATPFLIVVPVGDDPWKFKADITSIAATKDLDAIPEYCENPGYSYKEKGIIIPVNSFETSSAQAFTSGEVLNMPSKSITLIWAPVNCGYEAASGEYKGYPYGRMYQWGRKYGHGYKDSGYEDACYPTEGGEIQKLVHITKEEDLKTVHPDGDSYNGEYYCNSSVGTWNEYNWYGGSDADKLWDEALKGAYDPCPEGWKVPTKDELKVLLGKKKTLNADNGIHGTSEVSGSKFDGADGSSDNYVFLPIAGFISMGGVSNYRANSSIHYWSSSVDGKKANKLVYGFKGGLNVGSDCRVLACSVRCVKE